VGGNNFSRKICRFYWEISENKQKICVYIGLLADFRLKSGVLLKFSGDFAQKPPLREKIFFAVGGAEGRFLCLSYATRHGITRAIYEPSRAVILSGPLPWRASVTSSACGEDTASRSRAGLKWSVIGVHS